MENIAIVGASGFVGTHLIKRLSTGSHKIYALGRSKPKFQGDQIEWRSTDLFSMQSTLKSLAGVDVAIYLVHSMMPSSVLFQGNFHDTDLLLADNFARACRSNGVKRIIYLSGLMPVGYVSPHLKSRCEVEGVLRSTGIPTTVLRAGMIVGPGGSSYEILRFLVQRLPFMVLPNWTQRSTQAVFIDDVVSVLLAAISSDSFTGKTLDVVNGESLTYETLLRKMAKVLKVRRRMLAVPINSTGFSKLWVQIFGNSTYELVSPLIDSLLCDLPRVHTPEELMPYIQYQNFEMMVEETFKRGFPASYQRPKRRITFENSVRSVQRLPATPAHDCHWIAQQYMRFLPSFIPYLIRVKVLDEQDRVEFYLSLYWKPLLILKYIKGDFDDERKKFFIIGGFLTKTIDTGWLEFRQVDHRKYTLAGIHEFIPALPWMLYLVTQAFLHKIAMASFGRYLEKVNHLETENVFEDHKK
jgi:uncharacterized protein YbjT (DUF2867 family)